jgi:N-terminal TM domain of oligopeptide transport permease C
MAELAAGPQLPAITKLNIRSRSPWQEAWERFLKNKASLLGLVIVIIFLLIVYLQELELMKMEKLPN